jgi:hypothetical protein
MPPLLRITGFRRDPMDSIPAAAAALWATWAAMRPVLPADVRWFVQRSGRARDPLYSAKPIEKAFAASGPRRPSEIVPGRPTHRVGLVATRKGEDVALLFVGCCLKGGSSDVGGKASSSPVGKGLSDPAAKGPTAPSPGVEVELSLDTPLFEGLPDPSALAESTLGVLIRSLDLEAARAVPGSVIEEPRFTPHLRVGWLTFFPRRMEPLPPLPPGFESATLDEQGWLLRARPSPPAGREPEYKEALAHLRHALGARALLDGPSFAPPSKEPVREPERVPPEAAPEPGIPSYLKAAPAPGKTPVSPQAPVTAPAPVPSFAASSRPFASETSDIDLAKILQATLPFDPNAAHSAARASGRGRWIRFNPQTGEPLAVPYWEDLAASKPPAPAPEAPPERSSTGTVEIDPEMIARILMQGRRA